MVITGWQCDATRAAFSRVSRQRWVVDALSLAFGQVISVAKPGNKSDSERSTADELPFPIALSLSNLSPCIAGYHRFKLAHTRTSLVWGS
jgi:hypothetical protein